MNTNYGTIWCITIPCYDGDYYFAGYADHGLKVNADRTKAKQYKSRKGVGRAFEKVQKSWHKAYISEV
jgi:hypothetical protein